MYDKHAISEYKKRLTVILEEAEEDKDMDLAALADELGRMEGHLEFLAQVEGLKMSQKKSITHISNLIKKVKQELDFFDPERELTIMFPNGYDEEDASSSSFFER